MGCKIQTVYDCNTRRRTIKVYAGIATLDFARRRAQKQKNGATDTPEIEHTASRARGVRVSAVPIVARSLEDML